MTQRRPRQVSRRARRDQTDKASSSQIQKLPTEIDETLFLEAVPIRRRLLTDLANLRDEEAIQWFWKTWSKTVNLELAHELLQLRDDVRAIWREPQSHYSRTVLDAWLVWTPSGKQIEMDRRSRGLDVETPPFPWKDYLAFRCSLKSRRLIPNPRSMRANLVQGTLENWHHFRFCTNRDCLAPYFVAKRSDQTVCDSGQCKAERQREHARKWWNENRAKSASAEKVRKQDGTRKAR
jgi:hypothetical protein